jgi:2-dehydropantoate 2-reductase
MRARPRILVVGCGGIGGVTAAHLLGAGHDVTVLTTNPTIAAALRSEGLRVTGPGAARLPAPRRPHVIDTPAAAASPFDYVLLATQPPQVEQAARDTRAQLADHGRMVCFQNGLCEERVGQIVGLERVLGAVVTWGASMSSPGIYERTSTGGFVVGYLDGRVDEQLDQLAAQLAAVGDVQVTQNLAGARWSKLAINSAISTLGTIGGERLGHLLQSRHVRRLALEIMSETVDVARAERIRLEKVSGTFDLDWIRLRPSETRRAGSVSLVAKHGVMLAIGARYRRLRSSMLSAIERGRTPAVDFLNGEVITRAARHAIPVPVNRAARDLVWAIAQGREKPSHAALRALYEATR